LWSLRSYAALPGVRRCHHLLLLSLALSVAVLSNYVPPADVGVPIQPSTGT
jgi:hypothetical protein